MRSSDQALLDPFGLHFGRLWGSKFGQKLGAVGTKYEPSEDDTLLEVLKCAKSIFEQQSMHFEGFQSSPKYVDPWFWKQKSTLTLILKQI